jgi:hypothetical protein
MDGNVRFGYLADPFHDFSLTAASEGKADMKSARNHDFERPVSAQKRPSIKDSHRIRVRQPIRRIWIQHSSQNRA